MTSESGHVVIDTNIVSYIFNKHPIAEFYKEKIRGKSVIISFQTLEELWYGAYSKGWGDKRIQEVADHLKEYEVFWADDELVEICARLRSEGKSAGHPLMQADAWIAATAIRLKCPLVSHDGDFSNIPDLQLIRSDGDVSLFQ